MAVGAGYLAVPLVGIPLTALAAFLFRPLDAVNFQNSLDGVLTMRIGLGRDPESLFHSSFDTHLQRWSLKTTTTVKHGAALSLTYAVRLHSGQSAIPLVTELNSLEGVQDIELK